jgi:hypothetical protein
MSLLLVKTNKEIEIEVAEEGFKCRQRSEGGDILPCQLQTLFHRVSDVTEIPNITNNRVKV